MEKDIVKRTFAFSVSILAFMPFLRKTDEARVVGRQLLRCGTSVGANVEESRSGSSRDDFIHKMNISLREAREAHYWLRLIKEAGLASNKQLDELIDEADQIRKILGAIVSVSRGKRKHASTSN